MWLSAGFVGSRNAPGRQAETLFHSSQIVLDNSSIEGVVIIECNMRPISTCQYDYKTCGSYMKTLLLLCFSWMLMIRIAAAAEYVIDFGVVTDLERVRPLIDLCTDFGSLERNRSLLENRR